MFVSLWLEAEFFWLKEDKKSLNFFIILNYCKKLQVGSTILTDLMTMEYAYNWDYVNKSYAK